MERSRFNNDLFVYNLRHEFQGTKREIKIVFGWEIISVFLIKNIFFYFKKYNLYLKNIIFIKKNITPKLNPLSGVRLLILTGKEEDKDTC